MKAVKSVTVFVFTFFLVSVAALYFLQERLIFPAPNINVGAIQYEDFDAVSLPTPDGEHLFGLHHTSEVGEPTILIFHGNGGAAVSEKTRGEALVAAGFGVLLIEYRGYPGSTGSPSEAGFQKDALAAYDYIFQMRNQPIGLYAHSLGTGVAVKLASEREVFAMVLEAPFNSLMAVAQSRYPWVPVSLLLKHKFKSDKIIGNFTAPLLIMHGDRDGVIPIEHGEELFRRAVSGSVFEKVVGAGHNDLPSFSTHLKAVQFFQKSVK